MLSEIEHTGGNFHIRDSALHRYMPPNIARLVTLPDVASTAGRTMCRTPSNKRNLATNDPRARLRYSEYVAGDNPIFDLNTVNLPIWNIRAEFDGHLAMLTDEGFLRQLHPLGQEVRLPNCTFHAHCLPRNVLTYILQRSILSVESCVSAAVTNRLAAIGKLDDAMVAKLDGPFNLPPKGGGTAHVFYNKLPSQVGSELALQAMYPELWETVKQFYRDVRNRLFHGYQLESGSVNGVLEAHRMLVKVYAWMDEWWDRSPMRI